jgi:hypothetical protein
MPRKAKINRRRSSRKQRSTDSVALSRSIAPKVVTSIKKTYGIGAVLSSSSAEVLNAYNFTVNSIEDIASYAACFDLYRITRIEVSIRAMSALAIPTGTLPYTYLVTAIDLDDSAAESTVSRVLNYQSAKIVRPGQDLTFNFVPRVATALYSGAFSSYGSLASPWIDAASLTVQHYGLKTGIIQSTSSNAHGWYIFATLFVDFASPR